MAHELRRAGFDPDDVWLRATRPRVLPRDVRVLMENLPKTLSTEINRRLPALTSVVPSDARFLGKAYVKQVDVAMARNC